MMTIRRRCRATNRRCQRSRRRVWDVVRRNLVCPGLWCLSLLPSWLHLRRLPSTGALAVAITAEATEAAITVVVIAEGTAGATMAARRLRLVLGPRSGWLGAGAGRLVCGALRLRTAAGLLPAALCLSVSVSASAICPAASAICAAASSAAVTIRRTG